MGSFWGENGVVSSAAWPSVPKAFAGTGIVKFDRLTQNRTASTQIQIGHADAFRCFDRLVKESPTELWPVRVMGFIRATLAIVWNFAAKIVRAIEKARPVYRFPDMSDYEKLPPAHREMSRRSNISCPVNCARYPPSWPDIPRINAFFWLFMADSANISFQSNTATINYGNCIQGKCPGKKFLGRPGCFRSQILLESLATLHRNLIFYLVFFKSFYIICFLRSSFRGMKGSLVDLPGFNRGGAVKSPWWVRFPSIPPFLYSATL